MGRLRYNGLSTTLGGSGLTNSATSVTFAAALTHSAGTNVPTISSPDYIPLEILDSSGKLSEIVYLTAYTAAATTGTIARGKEGTAGVSHSSGDKVKHGPTFYDAGRALISKQVLGSAAASITFSSIPDAFEDLLLTFTGRSDAAVSETAAYLAINGDTTATNYRVQYNTYAAATFFGTAADDRLIGHVPGSSAQANAPGSFGIDVRDYANTTFHKIAQGIGHNARQTSGANEYNDFNTLHWENTAAITSLTLTLGSGNWVAGTIARLYGLA